ncbi:MAG: sensor domain-containing diguanylate cyclase [Calditerrivibrio sp.]|nr:sensor domain-containing diguanylate cyclase [Calditerrivibrio sp.]
MTEFLNPDVSRDDCSDLLSVLESSLDGIWAIDRDCRIIFFNSAFKDFMKNVYGIDVKLGILLTDLFKGIDGLKWNKIWKKVFAGDSLKRIFSVKTPSDVRLTILFRIFPLRKGLDQISGAVIIGRNITRERKKEKLLRHNLMEQYLINEVFKSLFNPKDFNEAVEKVLSIIGEQTKMSFIYVYEDYYDSEYCHLAYKWKCKSIEDVNFDEEFNYDQYHGFKESLIENNILMYNKYSNCSEGVRKFFEKNNAKYAVVFPMMIKGKYIGFIGFQENRSDRFLTVSEVDILRIFASILGNALIQKYTEEKLTYASTHDPLTGLYNRAYFDAEIERVMNGRSFPVSIVMADLNGLKQINDNLGHKEGDELIVNASKVLMKVFRKEDCVARIGGDEFAIILPKTDESLMKLLIERIRNVENEINSALKIKVSFALGGATAHSKEDIQKNIVLADEMMYEDKRRIKSQKP